MNLDRFKKAQESSFEAAKNEMKNGKKSSCWMWFIFPQIAGLGKSEVAKQFEIASIEDGAHYLMDEILSNRLIELTRILAYEIEGITAQEIFGFPDYLKFHSSMTLFYLVVKSNSEFQNNNYYLCFEDALRKYYDGKLDTLTLDILKSTTLFANGTSYYIDEN